LLSEDAPTNRPGLEYPVDEPDVVVSLLNAAMDVLAHRTPLTYEEAMALDFIASAREQLQPEPLRNRLERGEESRSE
jgi:hypothetical protein